jgi:DNA-binding response OmpR family regulator
LKYAAAIMRGLRAERYAVDVHHDGQSGWEAADTFNYDRIILDLMLPGLTGTEILEKVRRKNQLVPILILTARDGMADKIKKIELTAKEYSLLEYLATHPGRVFSRTMIIEHVWDQSFQGLTNIVDVYVRHLREKVDDAFPIKLLHTVRGVGYSLNDETQT